MLACIRKLKKPGKWDVSDPLPWLGHGEIPADTLENLVTNGNSLSIFEVGDDTAKIERVAAAMSVPLDKVDDFEYILFEPAIPSAAKAKLKKVFGDTQDKAVNSWHYDITELSGEGLVRLAKLLLQYATRDVVLAKQVITRLAESIASEAILADKVKVKGKDRAVLDEMVRVKRASASGSPPKRKTE